MTKFATGNNHMMKKSIAVLGAGSGSNIFMLCVKAGISRLLVMDFDDVEESNLNRTVFYDFDDIGAGKVDVLEKKAKSFGNGVRVEAVREKITGSGTVLEHVDPSFDIVINCADKPPVKIQEWINAACIEIGVPYVNIGFSGSIAIVGPLVVPKKTACVFCHKPDDAISGFKLVSSEKSITTQFGALSMLGSGFLFTEVMRFLDDGHTKLMGATALLNIESGSIFWSKGRARNANCPVCGDSHE
jgi:molybdopterin/thiamine biosynthesis adenylyltransferase